MNVEMYIKQASFQLKNSRREIEVFPDIAEEHIAAVKRKYKNRLPENFTRFLLIMSYTSTGLFFMTGDTFYYDNFLQGGLKAIRFCDLTGVEAQKGKLFSPDQVILKTTEGPHVLDACIDGVDVHVLKSMFQYIISKGQEGDFSVSEQGLLSYQIPEELKLLYLEILCNYAYINDGLIDADEYNAITKFSIRMELHGDTRAKLRVYMNDSVERFKTGTLLAGIKKRTYDRTGQWDAVRYCMMQDALLLHDIQQPGKPWREDGFIGSLMEQCGLHTQQVDAMVRAVRLNRQMVKKDAQMDRLKGEWKSLVKSIRNTPGYVPTPYLFCSGSVYGIKSYTGFLKKDETSQKAVNKQRELILQEIIMNNQKSVNVLIGDMNYLAQRLEKALEREDEIEQDYQQIKQLLCRIRAAARNVTEEEACQGAITENQESGDEPT